MLSLGCLLFPFRFVNLHCELISGQALNIHFNQIAPLNDIYFLFLIYFNVIWYYRCLLNFVFVRVMLI